jgi:hypothetical protein
MTTEVLADKAAQRAAAMRAILAYGDADIALVRESMGPLTAKVGVLMGMVKGRLLGPEAEAQFFDDDPDAALAFGGKLSEFIMRSSAGNFSPEYCAFVAGLADAMPKRPPLGAFVAVVSVVGQWIAEVLTDELRGDMAKLRQTLAAWQKMLAVNLDLLLCTYGGAA